MGEEVKVFEIHYSENVFAAIGSSSEALRAHLEDVWKLKRVEAASKNDAIKKLKEILPEGCLNYVLSITPIK